jgi:hypothetical protein
MTSIPVAPVDYILGRDVLLVPATDGSARLLDLGGEFYAIGQVGATMLAETLARGPQAAALAIAERFGVAIDRVESDLQLFLKQLQDKGLLQRGPAPAARRGGKVLPYVVILFTLRILQHGVRSLRVKAWILLALARLCFSVFGWTRTVAALQRCLPAANAAVTPEQHGAVTMVDQAVRRAAAGHLLRVECKERALGCWALLRSSGVAADLVIGIHLFPLTGHCWCEAGPWTLSDDQARCDGYQPVLRY